MRGWSRVRCGGDPGAFDELVRRYKDRVYGVIYRFVGNHEDAMDLAQDVFVRAYQGLHAYRGHSQVYTWLYSIAANLSRNRLRDRTRKGRGRGTSLEAMEEAGRRHGRGGRGPRARRPRSASWRRRWRTASRISRNSTVSRSA
jgi:RNA polymerase sigma factor (sigma-70 family)